MAVRVHGGDALGVVFAGEGGSVIVAAALAEDDQRPSALVIEGLASPVDTPWGVRAYPPDALDELPPRTTGVHVFGGEEQTREAVRAWASGRGLVSLDRTPPDARPPEGVRVVAVSAPTTGSGKTALTRKIGRTLLRSGVAVAVARHPIPSLLLWPGRHGAERVESPEALATDRPLEEREELAPVVGAGVPVVSGLDPQAILSEAARGARVVVWDGGGSALPWVRPDVHFVVIDLLRPLPACAADHIARADAVVLTKGELAKPDRVRETEARVRELNPDAAVLLVDMPLAVPESARLLGRRAVVVEDWPSLLLGGLKAGAGAIAARRFRNGVVDPRSFAVGAIAEALERHPHVGPVIPSLGRTPEEIDALRRSILATPGDVVLWASPASPAEVLGDTTRPTLRVYAEIMEMAGPPIHELLRPVMPGYE